LSPMAMLQRRFGPPSDRVAGGVGDHRDRYRDPNVVPVRGGHRSGNEVEWVHPRYTMRHAVAWVSGFLRSAEIASDSGSIETLLY